MKIVSLEGCNTSREDVYITLRSDSSILRNNDNFYMPDFSEDVVCTVGYTLHITRLAKCVEPRFASRCYDAVGLGVAFTARDVVRRSIEKGRPCDEAYCFDHSFATSPTAIPAVELGAGRVTLRLGEQMVDGARDELLFSLDECVSHASKVMTLKTGDIVYVSIVPQQPVRPNDDVVVLLDGVEMLNFQTK